MSEEPHEPASPAWAFLKAKPCGARTRAGGYCRCPGMKNGRCKLHGGKSSGPSLEGIERIRQAKTKHGFYSAAAKAERRNLRQLIKELRGAIADLKGGRLPLIGGAPRWILPDCCHIPGSFNAVRRAQDGTESSGTSFEGAKPRRLAAL